MATVPRPGSFVPIGVLTFVIDIKTMDIVLEYAHTVTTLLQLRDQFFEQSCFAAILFADNGYDGDGHFYSINMDLNLN